MSKAREIVETLRTVLVAGDVTNANFTGADLEVGKGGTGASSAGAARTALGVAIGTDVQAYDATILVDGDIGTTVLAPNGSAANLTNLPAGGAEDFVASGTLPNGKPVILKANGQVEVVAITSTPISQSIPAAAAVVYETGAVDEYSVSFDPNTANKFVIAYRDPQDSANNYQGKAIIGTISGTTLSFGTPVNLANVTNATSDIAVAFDPNTANKFVVAYRDESVGPHYGTTQVGTVSGTSISFGSRVVFLSAIVREIKISFDPNTSGKFVLSYYNQTSGSRGEALIGTLSGTTTSFGSGVVYASSSSTRANVAFDPNTANKFVITFRSGQLGTVGTAVVGTVSGNSISFGSLVAFDSSGLQLHGLAFDPNVAGKFVVVYRDYGNGDKGTGIVGQISGTTTSFGSKYVFSSLGETNHFGLSFDPNTTGKFVVAYSLTNSSTGNITGEVKVGTISNTALSFSSAFQLSADAYYLGTAFDPNSAGKFVITYYDGATSGTPATARLGQIASAADTTNLTSTNFLGTATAAYTNGQTASIMLKGGISDNQTSLTAGSTYYVQPAGTFATSAGTPSVLAGEAVSATSLLLNGLATPAAPDEIPSQSGNTGKFLTTDGSAASWGVASAMTVVTPVATTSGSAIDFTGIPSGTKQIIVSFWNVSTNAADPRYRIQLGDAGGIETSGYTTCAMRLTDGANLSAYVTGDGIALMRYATASEYVFGQVILQLQDSSDNTWVSNGNLRISNQSLYVSAGAKTLSAELDKVRVICNSGQTFDFGEIGLAYI